MLDVGAVEKWIESFVDAMSQEFGYRLVYVGHHGSWARGEARPDVGATVCWNGCRNRELRRNRRGKAPLYNALGPYPFRRVSRPFRAPRPMRPILCSEP